MLNLVLGAIAISFSAVFMKLVTVGPTAAAFYRMASGGVVLAGLVTLRGEWPRPEPRLLLPIGIAAACFALDLVFWHRAILYLGTGLATLLANFQVFVLAIAGVVVFRERLDWRVLASVPLAVVGLALIVGLDWSALEPARRTGVLLGLATAICYSAYLLAIRTSRVERRVSAYAQIALVSLACAGLLALLLLAEGGSFAVPGWRDRGLLLGYGIVAQVLGWVLISTAVHRVPASRVGLVLLLQPTFAYVWDVAFFDRTFSSTEVAGAALALIAIRIGTLPRARASGDDA